MGPIHSDNGTRGVPARLPLISKWTGEDARLSIEHL